MWARRPDGVGTVTHEEKEKFQDIKERLRVHLEFQITNFRYITNAPPSLCQFLAAAVSDWFFGASLFQIVFPVRKTRGSSKSHTFPAREGSQ